MKIQPINNYSKKANISPSHKAALRVYKSVKPAIMCNENAFWKATEMYRDWLKNEMKHIIATVKIRKNTELIPKVAIERLETERYYYYPHEESGYDLTRMVKHYENLEFEMNNRKCGFWLDKDSSAEKLFSDFKNMFNYLNK